jgi:hypothetical protein
MATVEIFKRETGEVTKTIPNVRMRSFLFYWDSQANDQDYDFRVVEDEKEEAR